MARSEEDVDWQSTKKTVLERSRHMFNNRFMSDIKFSCEGSDKKFFAHKYVLATSSTEFHAMFYGELAEKNSVVHLSDTSEEILEEFLRFLYTDDCNLTTDNAMFVLYLAKTYTVPSLAQKCIEFLGANLEIESAVTILQQAIQFDEKKLETKCWDFIDLKTSEVVTSDAFVDIIDQATLEKLLKRESLRVEEVDLFKAVLKWSEAECSRKGIEASTKNKRVAIGSAIYQIRFASMTLQEFRRNVSHSGILTQEENDLLYDKLSGVEVASEVWNFSERRINQKPFMRCSRFARFSNFVCSRDVMEEALAISFSKPVKFRGVRLLGKEGTEHDVKLEVFLSHKIEKKFLAQAGTSDGIPGFDVMLPSSIRVKQADTLVPVKATIRGSGFRCLASDAQVKKKKEVEVNVNDITVKFKYDLPESGRSYFQSNGIFIHQIIFSEM